MRLPARHICTYKVAHDQDKKGELKKHTLQFLRYQHGLKFDIRIDPHEAMSDVLVLETLFKWYMRECSIDEMVRVSSKPILLKKMNFGKYQGMTFKEIAIKDFDYLMWMRRAMTLDENMKYTVEYYINNR